VTAGFILGFDTDDEGVFDRQIAFIQEAGIPIAMIGILIALPNTALYRRLEREGRLKGSSTGNNTHTLSMSFVPRLPEEVLVAGYKRVLSELYSPRRYFERLRRKAELLSDRDAADLAISLRRLAEDFVAGRLEHDLETLLAALTIDANGRPELATDRISAFDVVMPNAVPGKGIVLTQISRFWFDLTLEKQAEAASPAATVPCRADLAGLRVLVVDPSEAMRRSFATKLENWGCRAEEAADAEGALATMRAAADAGDPFRFMLTEHDLPGGPGEALGHGAHRVAVGVGPGPSLAGPADLGKGEVAARDCPRAAFGPFGRGSPQHATPAEY
jgi:CheY-like chemotaxis protein